MNILKQLLKYLLIGVFALASLTINTAGAAPEQNRVLKTVLVSSYLDQRAELRALIIEAKEKGEDTTALKQQLSTLKTDFSQAITQVRENMAERDALVKAFRDNRARLQAEAAAAKDEDDQEALLALRNQLDELKEDLGKELTVLAKNSQEAIGPVVSPN